MAQTPSPRPADDANHPGDDASAASAHLGGQDRVGASRRLPLLNAATPPVRAGVIAGGSTAVTTLLVTGASAAVAASGPTSGLAWVFGQLTGSFLLLGMVAVLANFVLGVVRWKNPAGGLKATIVSGLVLALTFPVIVYMVSVIWLPSALYVFLSLLLICIPAGVLFIILARLPLGPRQHGAR